MPCPAEKAGRALHFYLFILSHKILFNKKDNRFNRSRSGQDHQLFGKFNHLLKTLLLLTDINILFVLFA